jgi:hypothetical protein
LKAMSALSRLSDMKHDKHRKRQAQLAGFSFAEGIQKVSRSPGSDRYIADWSDVTVLKAQMIAADGSILNGIAKPQNRMLASPQKPSSTLRISTHVASAQPDRRLAERYKTLGGTWAVQCNLEASRQLNRPDHELIWKLVASSLTADIYPVEKGPPIKTGLPPRFVRKRASCTDRPANPEDHSSEDRNVEALSQM